MPASSPTATPGTPPSRRFHVVLCLLGSAACTALAFPPIQLWPAIFIAVMLLIHAARIASSTRSVLLWAFGIYWVMWLWIDAWIIDVTGAGWPALAAYMAVYAGVAVWCLRRFESHPLLRRLPTAWTAPVVFVGLECVRGLVIFDGYAWYLIGQPLIDAPVLAQLADLFGIWWGSFFVAAVAGLAADVLRPRWRRSGRSGVIVACLLTASVPYGIWRLSQVEALEPGPAVLAIQTNLPQNNKVRWTTEAMDRDVASFVALTEEAVGVVGLPDLVVWPETMVPGFGFDPVSRGQLAEAGPGFTYLSRWPLQVEQLAAALDRPMLVGSSTNLELSVATDSRGSWIEAGQRFNSAVLVDGRNPVQRYDKVVLTPFGERMPYLEHWPWLEQQLMAIGAGGMKFNLDASDVVTTIDVPDGGAGFSIGTPICFEDTAPGLVRRMVYGDQSIFDDGARKRVELLINLSNDGWFGAHDAARVAHSQIARWRCIENRVPMIRAVNTGDTAWFDSSGRVVATAPSRTATWLECSPQLDLRSTIFGTMFGNVLAWTMLLSLFCTLLSSVIRPIEETSTNESTS